MTHPLVLQLQFARSEWLRGLDGITAEEAVRRFEPMNSIGWMIGHLANQEHNYWVIVAQEKSVAPGLNDRVGYGKPASTPPLDEMWAIWHAVTEAANPYLDSLTADMLSIHLEYEGKPLREDIGTRLLRNIYHYWYHLGEALAVRQQLGHTDLPQFVGGFPGKIY